MTGIPGRPEGEACEAAVSEAELSERAATGEAVLSGSASQADPDREESVWSDLGRETELPDPAESVGEARAVPVRMFDFEYNIMSDKPRLVEILAATIDREARRLKSANPSFNRGAFNWPVQVAFKLALDGYHAQRELNDCRRELENLTAKVERDAEKLAELIETGLDAS